MELNPEHPATQAAHDQWHKIAALLVKKLGGKTVITSEGIAELTSNSVVLTHFKKDSIELEILLMTDAALIAMNDRSARFEH